MPRKQNYVYVNYVVFLFLLLRRFVLRDCFVRKIPAYAGIQIYMWPPRIIRPSDYAGLALLLLLRLAAVPKLLWQPHRESDPDYHIESVVS